MDPKEPGAEAQRSDRNVNEVADDVAKGIAETVGAVFGVGVSIARLVANATAPPGRTVNVTPGQGPLSEMIQYGVAAFTNVIRIVPSAIGDVSRAAGGATRTAQPRTPSGSDASVPTVRAGSTLRVPLSIENPSDQPMREMRFSVLRVASEPSGNGTPLSSSAIRFEPAVISVAPRDFEKLKRFSSSTPSPILAPGRYDAAIGLADGGFELSLPFEVVPVTPS